MGTAVIIGGTSGVGRSIAEYYATHGLDVVITGRSDADSSAARLSRETGASGCVRGLTVDLAAPHAVAPALRGIGSVDRLVIAASERDDNSIDNYAIDDAVRLAVLKVVGYPAVVSAVSPRLTSDASVLLFGGRAKDVPFPGSTTTSSVNAAVTGLVTTLARELAPVRVNAIHPGLIGDSAYWKDRTDALRNARSSTYTGALVTTADVTDASIALLENRSLTGVDLVIDGGRRP